MKKTLLILVLLFACIGTQAQENVDFSKKKEIISPEINPDNSVTFRLDAKNAKEVKVQGDCVPEGGILTKGEDGIWTLTTKKLNPELYSYSRCIHSSQCVFSRRWKSRFIQSYRCASRNGG
jgi:enterochelin esterase family protein